MKTLMLGILLSTLLISGCKSSIFIRTKYQDTRTGLFGNNREELLAAFEKIEKGKTTKEDLGAIGLSITNNVEIFEGVPAFKELFGQEAFRNLDPLKFEEYLPEYNRYSLIQYPYKQLEIKSDRVYINRRKIHTFGWDIMLTVVLRDDIVIYSAPRKVFWDKMDNDKAFLQGLVDIIEDIGTFGDRLP